MAGPYNPPLKNTAYESYVSLRSFATPGSMQANPTLAAGDVKLYIDGVASTLGAGSSANLITLPTVVGTTVVVKVVLANTEMNADNVTVVFIDQTSPKEWEDLVINLATAASGFGAGGASAADIADAVWDEALSGHLGAGTTGESLDTAASGGSAPSAATIADAVWDEALGGHTTGGTSGKALGDVDTHTDTETGAAAIRAAVGLASANLDTQLDALPTANESADALLDRAAGVETGHTLRQSMRLMLAALVGKVSGAGGTTVTIRDTSDSKNRITATVDADGNRSAVTLDQS